MMIELRPARPDDRDFACNLYVEAMAPYAGQWASWHPDTQRAAFAELWRPEDTRIVVLDAMGDVGWVEARRIGGEIFLKQIYIIPVCRCQGIGTQVVRKLLAEVQSSAASMGLFVFKNNPASRLYERLGFTVACETPTQFVMRCVLSTAGDAPIRPDTGSTRHKGAAHRTR